MKSAYKNTQRAKSSDKMTSSKNTLTYKDKAKHYYLGMKNNWMGNNYTKILEDYKSEPLQRKSQTAQSPISLSIMHNPVSHDKNTRSIKVNKKAIDGISVKSPSHYKRLNRKYYKSKIREDRPKELRHSSYLNSKRNNVDMIYQEVKSYYEANKIREKLKQKMKVGGIQRIII